MKFQISHKAEVVQQIHALHAIAKKKGVEVAYVAALKETIQHLQTHPLEWGDPEYHQHHEGSVICHAVADPIVVRFAVYQIEEKVHILEIRPSSSALASDD
jgi:hypothetical protein